MGLSDQDVFLMLRRMGDGDVGGLEAIYRTFQRQIFVTVLRKLYGDRSRAEDVVQQTFLALITNPGGYDPAKGPFIAWLHGVAHNKIIDLLRERGKPIPEGTPGILEEPSGDPDPSEGHDTQTRLKALLRCLDGLPNDQRDTVISGWLKEMTYSDVAKMLATEVGTVKSRIHSALKRLKDCLVRQLGAEAWQ